ncbi:MAG: hypothetical protein JW769_04555 [Parachlamydiales bacterium]|nr:hypothetical protein [Parachlamydiales bacterium]
MKIFFVSFVMLSLACFSYYGTIFIREWSFYRQLDTKMMGTVLEKRLVYKKQYFPFVVYSFGKDGKNYTNSSFFQKKSFMNEESAKDFMERIPSWVEIWVCSGDYQKSSLYKAFPYNLFFRAVISLLVFFYFTGMFLGKKKIF